MKFCAKRHILKRNGAFRFWRIQSEQSPKKGDRYRFWGRIEALGGEVLRVVTLEDKVTIYNAFPDRGFEE
jgi:hypothetical protein